MNKLLNVVFPLIVSLKLRHWLKNFPRKRRRARRLGEIIRYVVDSVGLLHIISPNRLALRAIFRRILVICEHVSETNRGNNIRICLIYSHLDHSHAEYSP